MAQKSGRYIKKFDLMDVIIWGGVFMGLTALGFLSGIWLLRINLKFFSFPV